MQVKPYIRIVVILGMVAVMCGTVSAATGIVAETQKTSAGEYQACTAPCECISESTAAIRWGAQGYERCSKTICGQDARGDIQYLLHPPGGECRIGIKKRTSSHGCDSDTSTCRYDSSTGNGAGNPRECAGHLCCDNSNPVLYVAGGRCRTKENAGKYCHRPCCGWCHPADGGRDAKEIIFKKTVYPAASGNGDNR